MLYRGAQSPGDIGVQFSEKKLNSDLFQYLADQMLKGACRCATRISWHFCKTAWDSNVELIHVGSAANENQIYASERFVCKLRSIFCAEA